MNRRTFVKSGALFVPSIFVPRLIRAQSLPMHLMKTRAAQNQSGGGITNNVALVGTNKGGAQIANTAQSVSVAMPSSVVNGNVVLVGLSMFLGSAYTWLVGDLTKSAGTSTIGTIVLDTSTACTTTRAGVAIYRVPITGSGSLTLNFNATGQANIAVLMGCAEFSGLNATPFDSGGSGGANGTSATESTGTITSATVGVIMYSASEVSSTNWTRNASDQTIFNDSNGSSDMTGLVQYKINNTTSNTLTSATESSSILWNVQYASYKTS